jgi:transposase
LHDGGMTATQAKWSERIREWRSSGKSAEQYAEGREFKGSTLRYWASMIKRMEPGEVAAAAGRVRMARVVVRKAPADTTIEVAVGPARVVVRAGFDRTLLRQVIEALGDAS